MIRDAEEFDHVLREAEGFRAYQYFFSEEHSTGLRTALQATEEGSSIPAPLWLAPSTSLKRIRRK
jgi:hypothetical protein